MKQPLARPRVLLSSVFGPYAQDDEFGSRTINPMELYHNQVTREQGPFSLRMFHRSWGILMIQENISAPPRCSIFRRARHSSGAAAQRLRHRRHLVDHRERRQSARDVPDGAASCRRGRRSWSAATSPRFRASRRWSMPTTSCAAKASRWMRALPGRGRRARRSSIPDIVSGFGCAHLGLKMPAGSGQHGGHDHSVGGLSDGLQLLHHVGVLRRQGQVS